MHFDYNYCGATRAAYDFNNSGQWFHHVPPAEENLRDRAFQNPISRTGFKCIKKMNINKNINRFKYAPLIKLEPLLLKNLLSKE